MQVVWFSVILQGNVAFQWAIFHGGLVELYVHDIFTVEVHLKVVSLAGHDHLVPLARFLRHVLGRSHRADDATVIVVPHLVVGFAGGVEYLTLNSRFYGILGVADAEIYAAVAAFGIFVLHLQNEVLVFLFGREVGIVALPTFFSGARMDEQGSVLLRNPVARGIPIGEILAIIKTDEAVLVLVMFSNEGSRHKDYRGDSE